MTSRYKNIIYIVVILLQALQINAQNKYGKQWVVCDPNVMLQFGKNANGSASYTHLSPLPFPPYATYVIMGKSLNNICDSLTGEVLFTTNGPFILDANANPFPNSDSLISPKAYQKYFPLNNHQGTIILPKSNRRFDVFFPYATDDVLDSFYTFNTLLHYEVDMNANGGFGDITKKRHNINNTNDNISGLHMDAVRHANGKDWWLLKMGFGKGVFDSVYFYSYLVTNDSIHDAIKTYAGNDIASVINEWQNFKYGEMKFSMDGTRFAGIHGFRNYYYGDFNRCNGQVSNVKMDSVPVDTFVYNIIDTFLHGDSSSALEAGNGIIFSPNNKFLYVSFDFRIYQIEINEPDSAKKYHFVLRGQDSSYIINNGSMQFAPDSSIIVFNANGPTKLVHGINYPDKKGKACGYVKSKIFIPTTNLYPYMSTNPNHPNWLLGADSSICWPLGTVSIMQPSEMLTVVPNPAHNFCKINFGKTLENKASIQIHNIVGVLVASYSITAGSTEVQIPLNLTEGVYMVRVGNSVCKLVVK
jgi:Secretion system C-terminal sorting domain